MNRLLRIPLWILGVLLPSLAWPADLKPVSTLTLPNSEAQKLQPYFPSGELAARLVWKGEPLHVPLTIDHEQRLIFSEPVQADLNGQLTTDQLRLINNEKSLYFTALKAFPATRLYVTLKKSGQILFIDLSTTKKTTPFEQKIIVPIRSSQAPTFMDVMATHDVAADLTAPEMAASFTADNYVRIIRLAWQQLYAPLRLIDNVDGLNRSPMHTQQWVPDLVYGEKVLAHPEASWTLGDLFVTAVELRNPYSHPITLDLSRDLCGSWRAALLYPRHTLQAMGSKPFDSTELFLISTHSFGESLEVCDGRA